MHERKQNSHLRQVAKSLGEKFYTPVNQCKSGGHQLRYVSNNACVPCLHASVIKWTKANADYYRTYQREYKRARKAAVG